MKILAAVAVAAGGVLALAIRGGQQQARLIDLAMQAQRDRLLCAVQTWEWMNGVPDEQRQTTDDFPPKRRYPVNQG